MRESIRAAVKLLEAGKLDTALEILRPLEMRKETSDRMEQRKLDKLRAKFTKQREKLLKMDMFDRQLYVVFILIQIIQISTINYTQRVTLPRY